MLEICAVVLVFIFMLTDTWLVIHKGVFHKKKAQRHKIKTRLALFFLSVNLIMLLISHGRSDYCSGASIQWLNRISKSLFRKHYR